MSNDDYLAIRDFNFEELNRIHKPKMLAKFKHDKIDNKIGAGYNTLYDDEEYTKIISEAFEKVIHENFEVSEKLKPIQTWIYCQNDEHFNCVWHNHANTSTINAVFYIDPPQALEGGGIQHLFEGENCITNPENNKIYMFPYWMDHRPMPQLSEEWRVCVNLEYFCKERPVWKENNFLW